MVFAKAKMVRLLYTDFVHNGNDKLAARRMFAMPSIITLQTRIMMIIVEG
jgi:hypothetical protein